MATIKGLLKLKNNAGSFDIIMPQTEAALVKMANGETVEDQVMANLAAVEAAQAAADAAQAAADAAQEAANNGNGAAAAAQQAADNAQAAADAAQQAADKAQEDANKGIEDAAKAQQAADDAQAAADAAQQAADQGIEDAAAAKAVADQAVLDAAAAQQQADKGVADAAAAQLAADNAQAAADKAQEDATKGIADALAAANAAAAAQTQADKGVADAATAKGIADQAVLDAAAAQADATKGINDAAGALTAAQNAQTQADKGVADAAAAQASANQGIADAAKAQAAADQALANAAAAQQAADKGIADAAAAKAVADQAVLDAAAAQARADKGVEDAAAAKAVADQAVLDAAAAQQQADKGVADAAAAQLAADNAQEAANNAQADATQALADAAAAQQAADAAQAQADENLAALQAIENNKNQAGGFMALDDNGLVPAAFIPHEFKEIKIVENVAEMTALENTFAGLSAFVKDATADPGVEKGGAFYIFDGEGWVKTSESESMDIVLNWAAIEGKPNTIAGYGITDAVNVSELVDAPAANKVLRLDAEGKLPADITGNAATATKLAAEVNIGINGDDVVAAHVAFDGSQAINIPVVLNNTGVTAGEYTKVQVDAKGRVVAATNLVAADIPDLDWAKITTGKPNNLEGYGIIDAVNKNGDEMAGFLTLHANPVNDMHAATKAYVDSMVQGLDVKESVRVATVANVNLAGLQNVDGVDLAVGDRVLVKNQDNAVDNGIYVVAAAAWTRAADAVNGMVNPGMFTFVEEGNVNNNNGFVLTNDGAIQVGATALNFAQFSGMGQVLVGAGLGKNGNEIFLTDTGVAAGTYTKVQVDAQGRVVAAEQLASADLPEIAWAVITGKPEANVADIDDAVAKRHEHANAAMLDKINEADGVMTYDGAKMATQAYADDVAMNAAQSMIALSANEPENMPVNGLWIEIIE